jgi:hypothetical protein
MGAANSIGNALGSMGSMYQQQQQQNQNQANFNTLFGNRGGGVSYMNDPSSSFAYYPGGVV